MSEIKTIDYNYPIGIAELNMSIDDSFDVEMANFNLHILFNVKNNYLVAHCLDVSIYSRINLKEKIKSDKKPAELANDIIKEICQIHFGDIVDHIINSHRNKIIYPFAYAPEAYWKTFRDIRMKRDNYRFNEIYENNTGEIEPYFDLKDKLTKEIQKIKGQLLTMSYAEQFIGIVERLREDAA